MANIYMSEWLVQTVISSFFAPLSVRDGSVVTYYGPMHGSAFRYNENVTSDVTSTIPLSDVAWDPQAFTYVYLFDVDPTELFQPLRTPLIPLAQTPVLNLKYSTDNPLYNDLVGRGWHLQDQGNGTNALDTQTSGSTYDPSTQFGTRYGLRATHYSDITFTGLPAATYTHFVVADGPYRGRTKQDGTVAFSHALWYGSLPTPTTVSSGQSLVIPAGSLVVGWDGVFGPKKRHVSLEAYATTPADKIPYPITTPKPPSVCFVGGGQYGVSVYWEMNEEWDNGFPTEYDVKIEQGATSYQTTITWNDYMKGTFAYFGSDVTTGMETRATGTGYGPFNLQDGYGPYNVQVTEMATNTGQWTGLVRAKNSAGASGWVTSDNTDRCWQGSYNPSNLQGVPPNHASFLSYAGGFPQYRSEERKVGEGGLTVQVQWRTLSYFLGLLTIDHVASDTGDTVQAAENCFYLGYAGVLGPAHTGRDSFPWSPRGQAGVRGDFYSDLDQPATPSSSYRTVTPGFVVWPGPDEVKYQIVVTSTDVDAFGNSGGFHFDDTGALLPDLTSNILTTWFDQLATYDVPLDKYNFKSSVKYPLRDQFSPEYTGSDSHRGLVAYSDLLDATLFDYYEDAFGLGDPNSWSALGRLTSRRDVPLTGVTSFPSRHARSFYILAYVKQYLPNALGEKSWVFKPDCKIAFGRFTADALIPDGSAAAIIPNGTLSIYMPNFFVGFHV